MSKNVEVIALYMQEDPRDMNIASLDLKKSLLVGDSKVIEKVSGTFAERYGIPQAQLKVNPISPGSVNVRSLNMEQFVNAGGVYQVCPKNPSEALQDTIQALQDAIQIQQADHAVKNFESDSKYDKLKKLYQKSLQDLSSQKSKPNQEIENLKQDVQKNALRIETWERKGFEQDAKIQDLQETMTKQGNKLGLLSVRVMLNQFRAQLFIPKDETDFYDEFISKTKFSDLNCSEKLQELGIDKEALEVTYYGNKKKQTIQRLAYRVAHAFNLELAAAYISQLTEGPKRKAYSKIFEFVTGETVEDCVFDDDDN